MNDTEFFNSLNKVEQGIVVFYNTKPAFFFDKNILEIGSGWGIFTRIALMSTTHSKVTTIDKIPTPRGFKKNTEGYKNRINQITGDSKDILPTLLDDSYDIVFIDGDHGYSGFVSDFKEAYKKVKSGGIIIIDDVYHIHNFGDEEKDDYGIMFGISQLAFEYDFKIEISPVGHGIGLIKILK